MKSFKLFFSLMLTLGVLSTNAQQGPLVTAILPQNFCQNFHSSRTSSFDFYFQLAGATDEFLLNFKNNASSTEGVINFFVETKTNHGQRNLKVELSQVTDFDFVRTLFQENGVQFVNDEGNIVSVLDWKQYTQEQCSKIAQLNTQIQNIETKLNYTLQNPAQKEMAESNGWLIEANNFLIEAQQAKKNYIESIK